MLPRVLEPEVMDTEEDAEEYDRIDHRTVNERFVSDFLSSLRERPVPVPPVVVDVGAGTARVPITLCRSWQDCLVFAVDRASSMLDVAVANVREARLGSRILCPLADARRLPFRDNSLPFVISNSLIHHIPEPLPVLREMCRIAMPGALLFLRDLFRPEAEGDLAGLVGTYAMYETASQRDLFAASLRAALTIDEVRSFVSQLPLDAVTVRATSDRHWTLTATKRPLMAG